MTQIVGIVGKESIVVGCESQYTIGGRKTTDAQKMSVVEFENGQVLVVQAGVVTNTSSTVRYMSELAKGKMIDDKFSVASIAEEAIKKVRNDILQGMQKRDYSLEEQRDFFNSDSHKCGLMIAYYFKESQQSYKPHLYTIRLEPGKAEPEFPFATLGAADHLVSFMLKQFPCEKMSWGEATSMVVEALERVKTEDIYCGGQIKIAWIDPIILETPRVAFPPDDFTNRLVKKLSVLRAKHAEKYRIGCINVMRKIHQENYKKIKKQLKAEEERGKKLKESAPGFTIFHQCSQCKHGFNIENTQLTTDRKGVRCPKCGKIDPINL